MSQRASEAIQRAVIPIEIPPLESGDHLTRHEFERRYQARPDIKKAELIEGVCICRLRCVQGVMVDLMGKL